jgi:hypothetical protein
MSSTKQRKVYVAVLGLALGGLAVDRLVLDGGATGPRDAAAAIAAAGAPAPAAASPAGLNTLVSPAASRGPTLAARLEHIGKEHRLDPMCIDDAFRPSLAWPKPASPAASDRPKAAEVDPTQAFLKAHRLMAVVQNTTGGAAIVNGRTLTVGMEIDGFKLVRITRRSATFEREGRSIELTLATPGDAHPGD